MATSPRLFGASYSVYVRIARLALLEKGVPYVLVPVDIFAAGGPPPEYRLRHPFGRIPAFEHDGFRLYETSAIARYADEAFDGPALQPAGARNRARCNQLIGIADNYAYPHLVWGIYVEQVFKPARGESPDPARVAAARTVAKQCLRAMEDIMSDDRWLVGSSVTLADLYAAPMFAYFRQAQEGAEMLDAHPRLAAWWSRMSARDSMRASEPDPR